jgi:hypothetical protein
MIKGSSYHVVIKAVDLRVCSEGSSATVEQEFLSTMLRQMSV